MDTPTHRNTDVWTEREQLEYFDSSEFTELLAGIVAPMGLAEATITLAELHHRPGAGVSGVYAATNGTASLYLGATAEKLETVPEGCVRLENPRGTITIWLHPADPLLPGLRLATTPELVEQAWGAGRVLDELRTLAYRPLRRAVMLARFVDGSELFLKVLRKDAALLHHKHLELLGAGIPAPVPAGEPVDQVLAFHRAIGQPLAEDLMHSPGLPLEPAKILGLLDALPRSLMQVPARPAWSDRLGWYGHAAQTALPERAEDIGTMLGCLARILENAQRGPLAPSHGDFYEANLFVSHGEITGVLDIDSAGPGYLVDDLACFLGHLAVLPDLDPRYAKVTEHFETYAAAFAEELTARGIGADGLYARTAAVVLSLVAGARDEANPGWRAIAETRLRLVGELLARAAR
ncbi:phosphotransferase [Paeniglutamicibacter gangotriensis]|uniref:Phosphotransferase n=1 Tax=Paeniglutamicibacter gangotriensis TaxID=254787 RepID=A0A5B0E7M4_9MICC|nr:phosphotransferase [Paeniglutamicibacter gangotriensis]KAA0974282.1 phosphotransferase [Paeniglutamicibacter gangotriensis]